MTPYQEKSKSGEMVWRIAYHVEGRRIRKTFRSQEKANQWARKRRNIAELEGRRFTNFWMAITAKERHELVDALRVIRKLRETDPKATMVEAVNEYVAKRSSIRKSITLREAIDSFLAFKGKNSRKGNLSPAWLKVMTTTLNKAHREIADSDKTLVEFNSGELEEFLDDLDCPPRTWNNYRNILYSVFQWGVDEGYLEKNPVTKIETFGKKLLVKEVIIPSGKMVEKVLKLSRKPKYRAIRPALDLGLGLMMRSSEIGRMDWSLVQKDIIRVTTAVGKYEKPRTIHRSDLLAPVFDSLMQQHGKSGPMVPDNWRPLLTDLFVEAGMGKPRNILRKTASTNHYHATGNEALTQEIMGHEKDSTIFRNVYRALDSGSAEDKTPITREDGKHHFDLWRRY